MYRQGCEELAVRVSAKSADVRDSLALQARKAPVNRTEFLKELIVSLSRGMQLQQRDHRRI